MRNQHNLFLSRCLPPLGNFATVTLAFFGVAAAAISTFGTNPAIWFANAIALVALLRHPSATWPVFLTAVWIADALAIHLFGSGPALLLAVPDVMEIAIAAAALRSLDGAQLPDFKVRQVLRLMLVALVVPAFSSAAGAAVLWWSQGAPFLASWLTWYGAALLGLLIVVPLLAAWSDPQLRKAASANLSSSRAAVLVLALAAVAILVAQDFYPALLFLSFPAVLVLTWAYGLPGATAGVLVVSAAALWATMQGGAALVGISLPHSSTEKHLQAMQIYLAAIVFATLPLAALLTQQRKLAAELLRVGEARTEFLAAMSHEIRSPMTGVLGMIDLLAAEQLPPAQKRYVEAMRACGRHLLAVINDILDFSRIESGKLELEEIDFSLPELLQQLHTLVSPMADERRLDLRAELSPHSSTLVHGDPTRLTQVLLNLVSNSIKFTESGGVTVTASQLAVIDGGVRFRFEVSDTGIGISPENIEQLFTAFTQADRSIARRHGGSGLGLVISRRLVEAMGGEIGATSTIGVGSSFFFELPLKLGDPLTQMKRGTTAKAPVRPRRILVAEDLEINREILRVTLTKQGHALVFAADGARALELVQRQTFDLVLMDVQMPVMDGVEATRRIRKLSGDVRSIPIIGLTANVMARERERYLEVGMNECLMKPVDWDQLEAAIARYPERPEQPLAPAKRMLTVGHQPQLVDLQTLNGLRRVVSTEEFETLVRVGIEAYRRYCAAMRNPSSGPAEIMAEAHKLKGSAGTLGLSAISDLAARIEAAVVNRLSTDALVHELEQTVVATHAKLITLGVLPGSAASSSGAASSGRSPIEDLA